MGWAAISAPLSRRGQKDPPVIWPLFGMFLMCNGVRGQGTRDARTFLITRHVPALKRVAPAHYNESPRPCRVVYFSRWLGKHTIPELTQLGYTVNFGYLKPQPGDPQGGIFVLATDQGSTIGIGSSGDGFFDGAAPAKRTLPGIYIHSNPRWYATDTCAYLPAKNDHFLRSAAREARGPGAI